MKFLTSICALLIFWNASHAQEASEVEPVTTSQSATAPPTNAAETPKVKLTLEQRKQRQLIMKGLQRLRREDSRKRSPDDWFVVGTAVVNPVTQHADICFKTIEGQSQTVESITEFVTRAPEGVHHRWQVFARAIGREAAEQRLAAVRQQYDEAVEYRKRLMKNYGAKSARRT